MEPVKLFISTNIIVEHKFLNGGILVGKDGKILKVLSKSETLIYRTYKDVEVSFLCLKLCNLKDTIRIMEIYRYFSWLLTLFTVKEKR